MLTAVASAKLALSAVLPRAEVPAEGVPITELDQYPDLLTSTEAPADVTLAAAVYAGTSNELVDGTPCRAVTVICMYNNPGVLTGFCSFSGNYYREHITSTSV